MKELKFMNQARGIIQTTDNLYPKQREIIEELIKNYNKFKYIITGSRQTGKSLMMLLLSINLKDVKITIMSVNKRNSKNLQDNYMRIIQRSEDVVDTKNVKFISFNNEIPDDTELLILDEMGFYTNDGFEYEEYLNKYDGRFIAISTSGTNSLFNQFVEDSKHSDKWKLLTINWDEVFGHDQEWKNEQIRHLGEETFKKYYEL